MKHWLIPIAALLAGAGPAQDAGDSQRALPPELGEPWTIITSDPAADTEPVVTPNGKWLVFVSERTGEEELFRTRLDIERRRLPEAIAPHPASDSEPAVSPDGKWLAFVSTRQDALGDVFLMEFPGGTPRLISTRGRQDRHPVFSEDGGALFFESAGVGDEFEWRRYDLKTQETVPADSANVPSAPEHPLYAERDIHPAGWALMIADDTNGNGLLDETDDPSAWEWTGEQWTQASFPLKGATSIAPARDENGFLVSANFRGNLDIAVVADHFLREDRDYESWMTLGKQARFNFPEIPSYAAAYLRKAEAAAPNKEDAAKAELMLARILLDTGRVQQAQVELDTGNHLSADEGLSLMARPIFLEVSRANANLLSDESEREELLLGFLQSARQSQEKVSAKESPELLAEFQLAEGKILRDLGRNDEALTALGKVVQGNKVSAELKTRAYLVRAEVFRQQGTPAQAPILEALRLQPENVLLRERAIERLMVSILSGAETDQEKIAALREFSPGMENLPILRAAMDYRVGQLLVRQGNYTGAEDSFRQAMALEDQAPRYAARATFALAELRADQAEYGKAVELYQGIESTLRATLFPGSPRFYQEARNGLIRQYVEKGRREFRLGDALLALNTFDKLLSYDNRIVEGWRGKIEAASTQPDLIRDYVDRFAREARRNPNDALAWYKAGLAWTYPDPTSNRAKRALETAVALNGTVPFYHQTLGFVFEQQWRETVAERGGRGKVRLLSQAAERYRQALGLVEPAAQPQAYADLLLNNGNMALEQEQFSLAAGYYGQRAAQPVEFPYLETEILFHRHYGIAAFRNSEPATAVEQFGKGLNLLDEADPADWEGDTLQALREELIGRRALALMEAGRLAEAEEGFVQVQREAPDDTLAEVRAIRNRVYLHQRMADRAIGSERLDHLTTARDLAVQGLEILENGDLKADPFKQRDGLFGLEIKISADKAQGGARLDLDQFDEKRFLLAMLGRIERDLGDPDAALKRLQQQLEMQPDLDEGNKAYYLAARAVTYSRMAAEAEKLNRPDEAREYLVSGLESTSFEIQGEQFKNTAGATLLLAQLAEWHRAHAPGTLALPDGSSLQRRARELLEAQDPAYPGEPVPWVDLAHERARLQYVLIHTFEMHFESALRQAEGKAGLDLLRSAAELQQHRLEAGETLQEMEENVSLSRRPEESNRLYLMAFACVWRMETRGGESQKGFDLLNRLTRVANETGQGHLLWWLEGLGALSLPDENARAEAASKALDRLLRLAPGEWPRRQPVPWAVFDALEAAHLAPLVDLEKWEQLWTETDRWRSARLRLVFETATPPALDQQEEEWLSIYLDLREQNRLAWNRARSAPLGAPVSRTRRERLTSDLEEHIAQGREQGIPAALLLRPQPYSLEDVSILLDLEGMLPEKPAMILSRDLPGLKAEVVYTAEKIGLLSQSDRATFADGYLIYLLGEGMNPVQSDTIRLANGEMLLQNLTELPLKLEANRAAWPGDDGQTISASGIATAQLVQITEPLIPLDASPYEWRIEGTTRIFEDIASRLGEPREIEAELAPPGWMNRPDRLILEPAFAAALFQIRMLQAMIGSKTWLGKAFPPSKVSSYAEDVLDAERGRLFAGLENNDRLGAIAALNRMIPIKQALGIVEGLSVNYRLLAQLRLEEEMAEEASRAAEGYLETIRAESSGKADVANAWKFRADIAARARQWDVAEKAYEEAIALYRDLDMDSDLLDAMVQFGVAMENAGRYPEAIEKYREARNLAKQVDDPVAAARQDLRIARIRWLYQSRYPEAEELALAVLDSPAAEQDMRLKIDAIFTLEAVFEKTARFEEAMDRLDQAEEIAEQVDESKLSAEIALRRANIHWFRAEYRQSLLEQRKALELAGDAGEIRLAAHNAAGLTYWALNDMERAFDEFDKALKLAERLQLPSEVASTENNIGLVHRSLDQYEETLNHLNRALRLDREQSNTWGEAYSLRNIGITYIHQGKAGVALEPLRKAIELSESIGDRTNRTKALLALGDALAELERNDEARQRYQEARDEAGAIPLPEVHWRALYALGLLDQAAGEPDSAQDLFAKAIEIVDRLRAAIRVEEYQNGFLLDKQDLYDSMVSLLLNQGNVREAFTYSEKSRGRNFIDLLGNSRIELSSVEDQELLERERKLRARVENLERKVGLAPPADKRDLAEDLDQARQAYSDFLVELRLENPQLSTFVEVNVADLEEIQGYMEPQTRLAVYHVLPDRVAVWLIGPDSVRVYETSMSRKELARRVQTIRERLQNYEDVQNDLAILANVLTEPFIENLRGVSHLGIVPHRELHTMPFAALPVIGSPNEVLLTRVALFYAPSASVLRYTFSRRDAEPPPPPRVLAIGDPELGQSALDLPFARKEAVRLQYEFPEIKVLTGEEATESWFLENVQNYGIIHIATHGQYLEQTPMFSAVYLAPDQENDGALTANEIFGMSLRADLVTLSACQTGLGKLTAGDGIVGLNRAFVYAGTRQLMTSLWRVDDVSTAVLIKHFYRNLDQEDRAEALRQAQLRVRANAEWSHPAHWSGMVLSGDWR